MKILVICNTYDIGGAGKAAARSARCIQSIPGVSVIYWALTDTRRSPHRFVEEKGNAYTKFRAHVSSLLSRLIKSKEVESINLFPTFYARKINNSDFDLVIIHWVGSGAMSLKDIDNINLPVFIVHHDEWFSLPSSHYECTTRPRYWFDDLLIKQKRRILKKCTNIFPSRWLRDRFEKRALSFNAKHLPNVYEPEIYNRDHSSVDRTKSGSTKVLFCAMPAEFAGRKGGHLLAPLVQQSIATNSNNEFYVIGGKSKLSNVTSLGYVASEKELAKILNSVDVCIVPSKLDNFPNVALEALACGTPVITCKNSGTHEMFMHSGMGIISEPTANDLLNAINNIKVAMHHPEKLALQTLNAFGPDNYKKKFVKLVEN